MTTETATKPIQLGDIAPDFTANSTEGEIQFHQWIGNSWVIFFSHPKDFTPVCTTELGEAAKKMPEFQKRGVKVVALSVDSLQAHEGWTNDINETQATMINFPIIADENREIANLYGMIH